MNDIFDVGHQHSHESGDWVFSEGLCVTCGEPATRGSWCVWHHPSTEVIDEVHVMTVDELRAAVAELQRHLESRDRCVRCGAPLVDGIERATGVCRNCRILGTNYGYT
jgi:hypothetical protein